MKYVMLLWPHANVRYQTESLRLALAELRVTFAALLPGALVGEASLPVPALEIELSESPGDELMHALRAQSLMYALFEEREDGLLKPLTSRAQAYVGADLPGVLKYKGKTNELFLEMLVNLALFSGGFAHRAGDTLELLDPMCGRGTALFVAANRGWSACGIDINRQELGEGEHFLKHYFEYHRMKHSLTHASRTMRSGSAPSAEFSFADTPEHYRQKDTRLLCLVHADAAQAREIFGSERFHMVVCDLPYGVQHSPVGGNTAELLRRALPAWRETLKKGGTVALSFNAQTLPRERVLACMEEAGLVPLRGGAYEDLRHWVEQAVTRDVAVARRAN